MIKGEIISQFDGFGNNVQETPLEYFRSSGFSKSANGITANKYLYSWYTGSATAYPQYTTLNNIVAWATGLGRDVGTSGGSVPAVFAVDEDGKVYQSLSGTGTPQLMMPLNRNSSLIGFGIGMIVDQNNRLLVVGQRYMSMFDPDVDETAMAVSATSGGTTLTATTGTFDAGMVNNHMRFFDGGGVYYYKIKTYTDPTHVEIFGTFGLATGSYSCYQVSSWQLGWKDFGSTISINNEGNNVSYPMETYEDTVVIGRKNNIVTLNTLTDSITTDASPALSLPAGFDTLAIHKGANGILIGSNFQRKGVLVLWDNFSDRSIAPWIDLPDRLISLCKYGGGWIAITSREVFYTDGYSITTLKKFFLDSNKTVITATIVPQSSVVVEDQLHFIGGYTDSGKRRAGLYKMDLTSKLFEFYPRQSLDQYTTKLRSIFYDAGNGNGRIFGGTTTGIDYLLTDSEPPVATYISSPIGQGENWKYAEGLKMTLGVAPQNSVKQSPYSFKIIAKICPMEKQMFNVGLVKTTMADTTHVVVNESTYHIASVGDEIEFIDGESAGYSRNITAISGSGTATATYTLDRAVPTVVSANYHFFITPFRLIRVKTYTNVSEMPIVEFEIKNRPKGKKFLIKIDIEDANVPIEVRPFTFLYDDTGTI